MAYEGQDKIDYEAGSEYLPLRFYQQKNTAPEIMGQTSGITSTGAAQPYVLPGPSTTEGDRGGGFGRWGNLDEKNMKMFDKDVWTQIGPTGGWQKRPVKGYMNVNTGHYQTEEGKNINHLGLEVPSIIGMIGNKLTGQKFGEKQWGDTKGTFTEGTAAWWNQVKQKRKIRKEQKLQQEIQSENLAKVQAVAAEQQAAKTGPPRSHTGEAIASKDVKDIGGGFHEYKDAATSSKYEGSFAQGGRIGYQDAGPVVDEETMNMVIDMHTRGSDMDTISTITQLPMETITSIISSMTQEADGGRVPFFYGGIATAL